MKGFKVHIGTPMLNRSSSLYIVSGWASCYLQMNNIILRLLDLSRKDQSGFLVAFLSGQEKIIVVLVTWPKKKGR